MLSRNRSYVSGGTHIRLTQVSDLRGTPRASIHEPSEQHGSVLPSLALSPGTEGNAQFIVVNSKATFD